MTTEEVLDRLAVLGEITSNLMFGGVGLYWRGVIFGMVFRDRLYFQVDEQSKHEYLARGTGPWDRSRIRQRFQSPKRQRARSLFATR